MAVDPDSVVVTPTPMSRNPNPVNATDVIARAIDIIRPVTELDIHNDSICHGCHSHEYYQKYLDFQFHTGNSISDYDERWTPLFVVKMERRRSVVDVVR